MKAIDLLETYPMAAEVINEFYRSKMLESLKTENVPEDFKELLRHQEFDNQYVATFIDSNPRILFDVFDANDVYIQINVFNFSYSINEGSVIAGSWKTRIEAEKAAIEQAFQILNDKL